MDIIEIITNEFNLPIQYSQNIVNLLSEGNTVPFIARYRKELHGSTDDQTIRAIAKRIEYLQNLQERKKTVQHAIEEQEKWTPALALALSQAQTLSEVDDIYRPYAAKKKTRASLARERGLEPLAHYIMTQAKDIPSKANRFLTEDVLTVDDAIAGALDIVSEDIANNVDIRQAMKQLFINQGIICTKAIDAEQTSVYAMYYDFQEPIRSIASHRVLAINRGEREKVLRVSLVLEEERALRILRSAFLPSEDPYMESAIIDAYQRLLFPSIEREIRRDLTNQANQSAIHVFSENLRHLLMTPPIKGKVILGFDPGFRNGCKLAVIDATGRVLDSGVIYPTAPHNKLAEAEKTLLHLIQTHSIELIAIGNGTASRESEYFIAELIRVHHLSVSYVIVNEAGASIYSASPLGAEEFPQYDVSIRSAISIARRLQDSLSELVKIDPQSIGVGQYQHDMPKAELSQSLDFVVEDCVNAVGVELNTASVPLLQAVAGIHESVAKNIVTYREENGAFHSRKELLAVPKLGKKTFEQCAGFLRIANAENALDNTAVHPESYRPANQLLSLCNISWHEAQDKLRLQEAVAEFGAQALADEINVGLPTLLDIIQELQRPGRDPRDELPAPLLRTNILSIEDLEIGLILTGTVRNVIDFGAFVDIGVHEDGLIHISQLADHYVKHPTDVLQVGDIVTVKVIDIDVERKRIALSMRSL